MNVICLVWGNLFLSIPWNTDYTALSSQWLLGACWLDNRTQLAAPFWRLVLLWRQAHQTHKGFLSPALHLPRKCLCLLVIQCIKFHNSEQPSGMQIPFQIAQLEKQKCFPPTPVKKWGFLRWLCVLFNTDAKFEFLNVQIPQQVLR